MSQPITIGQMPVTVPILTPVTPPVSVEPGPVETVYERVLRKEFERGRADALDLRGRASGMDGTGLIAEERKAPVFDPEKDYSEWAIGSPVRELVDGEYQVFQLLQPYNAAHYPGTSPSDLAAIWSPCHTKDPAKAKPYLPPNGTSGLWMAGEVCTKDGRMWRSVDDGNAFPPGEIGAEDFWEDLGELQTEKGEYI